MFLLLGWWLAIPSDWIAWLLSVTVLGLPLRSDVAEPPACHGDAPEPSRSRRRPHRALPVPSRPGVRWVRAVLADQRATLALGTNRSDLLRRGTSSTSRWCSNLSNRPGMASRPFPRVLTGVAGVGDDFQLVSTKDPLVTVPDRWDAIALHQLPHPVLRSLPRSWLPLSSLPNTDDRPCGGR